MLLLDEVICLTVGHPRAIDAYAHLQRGGGAASDLSWRILNAIAIAWRGNQ